MAMEPVKELLDQLNAVDESVSIEAKRGSSISRSIQETVCAFANEPGLGGGYILLGVEREETTLFPSYTVTGIQNPDKLQLDLATQCASMFNQPIRPEMEVEQLVDGKLVLKVFVPELPDGQKPLYFKAEGLPKGAYRRIGSSDQHCTDDDLFVFFNKEDSLDSTVVSDADLSDISEEAVETYRRLRREVSPFAEELGYSDEELLQSLGCLKKVKGDLKLTYTGLVVFGKSQALRRLMPMLRVDYIRIPGNEWVEDPENRFTTIDMRGPLITLVQRAFNAISDDLPKGFLLPEGEIQAKSIGLPARVLREAIVNAFIHRTYRESQPIQIIRYGNRIEIRNPGFSLKPTDQLGEPGSKNRNPYIAAIFHETNLAETKGSGIRTMRALLKKASLAPPTFESQHTGNHFTTRLLLHHFLSESNLRWLQTMDNYQLNDSQKRGLVFLRETGAVDNQSYRQINGCDVLRASGELRQMRDKGLLHQKGSGRYTYYVGSAEIRKHLLASLYFDGEDQVSDPTAISDNPTSMSGNPSAISDNLPPISDNLPPISDNLSQLPLEVAEKIKLVRKKGDVDVIRQAILALCSWQPLTAQQIAQYIGKNERYIVSRYLAPLRKAEKLFYTYPEMPNHPQQAYTTSSSN